MTTIQLTQLKIRLQDQHRRLNNLNQDLIRRMLECTSENNSHEQPFTQAKSFKDIIEYLRMIRKDALTANNLELIACATNIRCLNDLDKELDTEIAYHHELIEKLEELTTKKS